jgi:hypothetical protein
MSIKSSQELKSVLEHLSQDPDWAELDSVAKQKVLGELHEKYVREKLENGHKEVKKKNRKKKEKDESTSSDADS